MLEFKIYDHRAARWCADHQLGTHCFSNFVLSEDGKVLDFTGNYQDEFYSLDGNQEYLDMKTQIKKFRFTVCPWIGVRDNLGNKIYAGDIISMKLVEKEHKLVVKYDYDTLSWVFCDEDRRFPWAIVKNTVIKVIGNINK